MISHPENPPRRPITGKNRWKSLSPREQLEEFRELKQSPYWYFIPDDIKSRITDLIVD